MEIIEIDPINKITFKENNTIRLSAVYNSYYTPMPLNMDLDNFSKFGAFLYDKKDIPNILTLEEKSSRIIIFELNNVMTMTDVSMINQTMMFDINFDTYMINGDKDISNLFKGTILTPYILIDNNNEMILCIIIDNIQQTRCKKISKIKNATIKSIPN